MTTKRTNELKGSYVDGVFMRSNSVFSNLNFFAWHGWTIALVIQFIVTRSIYNQDE